MKKVFPFIVFIILFFNFISFSQNYEEILKKRGEIYFKFKSNDQNKIKQLSKFISIDKHEKKENSNIFFAYANLKSFKKFLKLNFDYEILPPPSYAYKSKMANSIEEVLNWDTYPSFHQYKEMMYAFQANYPSICSLDTIGTSINEREVLVVKISDNVNNKENEPEFLYTSTMHGDEVTGYVLMLRLIDYLLSNYGENEVVTYLIDNVEIWINPLSNPDGTYFGGDDNIFEAIRFNANYVDLNRNFPDPEDGEHPDNEAWQKENIDMMNFMKEHNFVLSANLHTGAEVLNYPWDTYEEEHADENWLEYICREYADTVQEYSDNYLTDLDNGITNGYSWYSINGGRQDYVTYFLHGREVTFELSQTKFPPANYLPNYWEYNYRSLLNYIKQVTYGIKGNVTDSITNEPLLAKIEILNHDVDSSEIYTSENFGNYHRLIFQGTYNLKFSADAYNSKIIENVNVQNENFTILDVKLSLDTTLFISKIESYNLKIIPNPCKNKLQITFNSKYNENLEIIIFDFYAREIKNLKNIFAKKGKNVIYISTADLQAGMYFFQIKSENIFIKEKFLKN